MKITRAEKWLVKRWTKAGLIYRPVEGGTDYPGGPIWTGSEFLYETPELPLPQTTTKNIFSIQGLQYQGAPAGFQITDIWGVVTVAIGAVANATKLSIITTDANGVEMTAVDICATVEMNAAPLGDIYSLTGVLANAAVLATNGLGLGLNRNYHIALGTTARILINCAGSDGGTGRMKWYMLAKASYGTLIKPLQS